MDDPLISEFWIIYVVKFVAVTVSLARIVAVLLSTEISSFVDLRVENPKREILGKKESLELNIAKSNNFTEFNKVSFRISIDTLFNPLR